MIKFWISITFFIIFLAVTTTPALAHGGVSKNVGSTVVYLDQSPLSPLVGESVEMNFVIRDSGNNPLANLPVTLKLTDTYYGDESKDKEILHQDFHTDNNGSFNFIYTYNKENYFDVDLSFVDPVSHESDSTGFLVQPRKVINFSLVQLIIFAALGLAVGFLVGRLIKNSR